MTNSADGVDVCVPSVMMHAVCGGTLVFFQAAQHGSSNDVVECRLVIEGDQDAGYLEREPTQE